MVKKCLWNDLPWHYINLPEDRIMSGLELAETDLIHETLWVILNGPLSCQVQAVVVFKIATLYYVVQQHILLNKTTTTGNILNLKSIRVQITKSYNRSSTFITVTFMSDTHRLEIRSHIVTFHFMLPRSCFLSALQLFFLSGALTDAFYLLI